MSLKPVYIPPTVIGALGLLPFLLKPFLEPPYWLTFLVFFLVAFLLFYSRSSWSNAEFRQREQEIYEECKSFYLRYPWYFIATISFVVFGGFIVVNRDWIDLTAAQAFSIGLAIWFVPLVIGDLWFGGRRSPKEEG